MKNSSSQWIFLSFLGLLLFLPAVNAQVVVVEPNITIIPPFSPQLGFPTKTYSFDFTIKNVGSGDVIADVEIGTCSFTCSLSGFTSGKIPERESKTTTLTITIPYQTLSGEYYQEINVTYDDAYGFDEIQPAYKLSNFTLIVKRARLEIEDIFIENITKIDNYWVLVVESGHDVTVKVNNSGNLVATDISFIWNIPKDWLIESVEYYSSINVNEMRTFKFHLIPTTIGRYSINFTINYLTSFGGDSLTYSLNSPLFNINVKDRPSFRPPDEGDIRNTIGVSGDLNYLNIFWNAPYLKESIRDVNVSCWLSCDPRIADCSLAQVCKGYRVKDICTIFSPRYNSSLECTNEGCATGLDAVFCHIYDREFPAIGDWANLSFRHLDFQLSAVSDATFTVGEAFVPIQITNKGLLKDNYTLLATPLQANIVHIELDGGIEDLSYGEWDETIAKLLILVGKDFDIYIRANSTTNSNVYKSTIIHIRSGLRALSDLDNMSLLQLILLSGVIFYFFIKRKRI